MKRLIIILLSIFLLFPFNVNASEKNINMHLFYGQECPHCEELIAYLNNYIIDNDNIKLYKYEIWHSNDNQNKFELVQNLLNKPAQGVPYLVIGKDVIIGYRADTTNPRINELVNYYENNNYEDVVGIEFGLVDKTIIDETKESNIEIVDFNNAKKVTIPVLGAINPTNVSLPLISIIIGLVDGFNPCSLWILLFLITMLLTMKNRRKMWILGITFIASSGIVYLLFMVSWLNLALFINKLNYIKIIIGLVGLLFGIINIVSYFKKRKEPVGCEVVSNKKRKVIIKSVTNITTQKYFILALLGIILLAVAVNIIELFCSLGLPLIFTEILSINQLSLIEYIIYMLIYIILFLLDDIVIFAIAMKTLKVSGISNKYTKYSHLIGGIIMILIGLLMIFKPEWLMLNF